MNQPQPERWTVEEVMAMHAANMAERYAALVASYDGDEDAVNAMLMFPWSSPVPKEPPGGVDA